MTEYEGYAAHDPAHPEPESLDLKQRMALLRDDPPIPESKAPPAQLNPGLSNGMLRNPSVTMLNQIRDENIERMATAPEFNPIESDIRAQTDEIAVKNAYTLRRQRRALVQRLVHFVRVEQLALKDVNDHTSVEVLAEDALMKALDAYFEGRPKASREKVSTSLETLELMRSVENRNDKS